MSGGLGKSESSQSSTGTFNQGVFPQQISPLAGMYGLGIGLAMESLGMRPTGKGGMTAPTGGGGAPASGKGGLVGGIASQFPQGGGDQPPGIMQFTPPSGYSQMDFGQGYQRQAMKDMVTPWREQMAGGAYGGMDLANRLTSSLEESLGSPTATQEINEMIMGGSGNDYLDAMQESMISDASRTTDMFLGSLDQRAAAAGMSGGSRHGTATAIGLENINRDLQRNMSNLGYETFDKDLQRKLQIAGQADQATLARQQMMQQMLGAQQGAMTGGLTYGQNLVGLGAQQQMFPWQQLSMLPGIIGQPTLVGSGTMSGSGGSSGKGIMGGL
jgi:hypothetical protein